MREAASNADGYHFAYFCLHQNQHDEKRQKSSGQGIKNTKGISKHKSGKDNTKDRNQKRIPRAVEIKQDHNHSIGKSQFHPRNPKVKGNQRFHVGKDQGKGKKDTQRRKMYLWFTGIVFH